MSVGVQSAGSRGAGFRSPHQLPTVLAAELPARQPVRPPPIFWRERQWAWRWHRCASFRSSAARVPIIGKATGFGSAPNAAASSRRTGMIRIPIAGFQRSMPPFVRCRHRWCWSRTALGVRWSVIGPRMAARWSGSAARCWCRRAIRRGMVPPLSFSALRRCRRCRCRSGQLLLRAETVPVPRSIAPAALPMTGAAPSSMRGRSDVSTPNRNWGIGCWGRCCSIRC